MTVEPGDRSTDTQYLRDLAACIEGADLTALPSDLSTDTPFLRALASVVSGNALKINAGALLAAAPVYYERSRMWKNKGSDSAANRRTLVSPDQLGVNIDGQGYFLPAAVELDLNVAASWDTQTPTNYAAPANRAGKDFYIYACQPESGSVPILKISAAATFPSGYDANSSRKIACFHCECVDVGIISGHTLTGYLAGDILPRSIQDLKHRPISGFMNGMVWAGKTDFDDINEAPIWIMIYLASGTGSSTISAFGATISDTRNWMDFVDDFAAIGGRMLEDDEFQAIAAGSNEETNIAGSADPVTTGGHLDTAGRRMISNVGCEDCCGAMHQWLRTQSYRYDSDGGQVAASQTATITYVASLEGAPVYLKWNGPVPYLCANIAADVWITIGSHKIQIKADADSITGGTQIYFDDDATQPNRLLSAVVNGKDAMIPSSHPDFSLIIKYNATPATPGVEMRYDNATHNRLEAINASGGNQSIDLALSSPALAYHDLPGSKGSLYRQGPYGDAKLVAGLYWAYGSSCGSRGRYAHGYRWHAASALSSRAAAEPA